MATYSSSLGHTVGSGLDYTFELPAITIPASERFLRCMITNVSTLGASYCLLRGNAQTVLGQRGFDTWTTNATAISWTNGGQPKVKVHNNGSTGYSWRLQVIIETEVIPDFTITCSSGTGGTLKASKTKAAAGTVITLTPTPAKGYKLKNLTSSPSVTISNNKFTMPASAITITATWEKIEYTLTTKSNPVGAGTVDTTRQGSHVSTATYELPVRAVQTPLEGYYFTGWTTSPQVSISSTGVFYMPASNLVITANYLKRSTATLGQGTLTGGETATLIINADKATFSHKYKLSFGENMETELIDVAAGVTSVEIGIPEAWSEEIPNDAYKGGGTLLLETYNGTTKIGEYTIQALTYAVPASAVPEVTGILTEIVRTIGGTTYANVGDYYVQAHSGVRIQAEAEGVLSSTIESLAVAIAGYTGSGYSALAQDDEIDFISGLLNNAGQTVITVTATDSRGRIGTDTATITVQEYSAPRGTLAVKRVDLNGSDKDTDVYGQYELTKAYTQLGTNSLTVKLISQGTEVTLNADTGDLLPGNRQTFNTQLEYTITLKLKDAFEETVITAKLPSAKFILYIRPDGSGFALFKANTKTVPTGKDSVFEISGDTQVYIGDDTLEKYILDHSQISTKEEVQSPVTWNSTYVTVNSCTASLYQIGALRMLTMGIYVKNAISASGVTIGTIISGHRPAEAIVAPASTVAYGSSQNSKSVQIRSDGEIRMPRADASTSAATMYYVTFIYMV